MSVATVATVEALLFIAGEDGLTIEQLSELLEVTPSEVSSQVATLHAMYADERRGLTLVWHGKQIVLMTKPEWATIVGRMAHVPRRTPLSRAALETLAIVALKQPITRVEIEQVRGVGCERPLRKLLEKQLIEEAGRMDVIGKPVLYRTSSLFLQHFQLQSLDELPSWEAIVEEVEERLIDHHE